MTAYVYSTATRDIAYPVFAKQDDPRAAPVTVSRVVIKGGSNVADKRTFTPYGVVTKITDEEAAVLNADLNFARHVKAGFMVLAAEKRDPEVIAADMEGRDRSAPLTPEDYVAAGKAPPLVQAA